MAFAGKPAKPAGGSNKGAAPYGKAVSAAAKAKAKPAAASKPNAGRTMSAAKKVAGKRPTK